MMNHHPHSIFILFISIVMAMPVSYSQSTFTSDSIMRGAELHQALRMAVDSAIFIQQKNVDSVSGVLDASLHKQSLSLKTLTDSLMKSALDLLDSSRIDSVYQLHKDFSNRLKMYGQTQQQDLRNQLLDYSQSIISLKNIHEACVNCDEPEDFMNELSSFYGIADSSSEVFLASLDDRFDDATICLSDSTGTLCDSLITFVETLIDNRETELDSIETHSNKLMISMDANSYSFYHGRDGGLSQAVVSPLISFRHSSGVTFSLGSSWLEKQSSHWDGTSLGLSYEFMFSSVFSGSISYTHFWFDSSSTQIRSVFNQSIDGELDLSTPAADFSVAAEINFDRQSEYAFELTVAHNWEFGRKVVLAPTLNISWGEQNLKLIAKQLQKIQQLNPKGKKTVTKTVLTSSTNQSNFFSILDYELMIPVSIRLGRFILTPSATAVFPLAIFDGSRDQPFLNIGLTASVDWIW